MSETNPGKNELCKIQNNKNLTERTQNFHCHKTYKWSALSLYSRHSCECDSIQQEDEEETLYVCGDRAAVTCKLAKPRPGVLLF